MKLKQCDQFEVIEEDGKIILVPVVIYQKCVIKNLKASVDEIKESIKNEEQSLFDSLFEELDN